MADRTTYEETRRAIADGEDVTLRTARWKVVLLPGVAAVWFGVLGAFLTITESRVGPPLLAVVLLLGAAIVMQCVRPATVRLVGDRIEIRQFPRRPVTYALASIREFYVWSMGWTGFCAIRDLNPGPSSFRSLLRLRGLPPYLAIKPFDLAVALNRRLAHFPSVERDAVVQEALRNWRPTAEGLPRDRRDTPFLP